MLGAVPTQMLFPFDNRLYMFQRSLSTLTADQRKGLVTICRAQYVPSRTEARILSYQAFGSPYGCDTGVLSEAGQCIKRIKDYVENPLYSGLVLDIIRAQEPTQQELQEMSRKSWMKEILACNTDRGPSSLNYAAIFDRSRFLEEFIPGVEARPEVNAYIHRLLEEWRDRIAEGPPLFPLMSNKACSHWTRREVEQYWPSWRMDSCVENPEIMTQAVLEKLYTEQGVKAGGPCELRQKLYRAGITPRTYFAQGGSAFFSSCYLQRPCSALVDCFPVSNHVLRLVPSNLRLDNPFQHVFIYDLTSFTSLFREFLPFIRCLAEFCRGTDVTVWDGQYGYVTEDLGEMWSSYADFNASQPPYSPERFTKEEQIFYHMCAGFLGVYGNLMICTFLHAVVVLAVVGEVSKCYTAGDDGGAVLMCSLILVWEGTRNKPKQGNNPSDDVAILFYALSLLGLIQWSKVFTTQEFGAVALKRPLVQVEGVLHSPQMVVWPQSILIQIYMNWTVHRDPRFFTYYMFNDRKSCRKAIISEVTRFLSHVAALEHRATDFDLQVVRRYVDWVYDTLSLPKQGLVPQFSLNTYADEFIANVEGPLEIFREDPFVRTIKARWCNWVYVPHRWGESDYAVRIGSDYRVGEVFVDKKGGLVSWLLKLGYLEERSLIRRVEGEAGYDLLVREYDKTVRCPPALYSMTVKSLPACMIAVT
jgi:hypothetical protein